MVGIKSEFHNITKSVIVSGDASPNNYAYIEIFNFMWKRNCPNVVGGGGGGGFLGEKN